MAPHGDWHNGRMYHLSNGFQNGNGSHHKGIQVGCWQWEAYFWSTSATHQGLYGWHDNIYNIRTMHQMPIEQNITGARMKFKPSKSRSVSIIKGKLVEQRFFIDQEPIPNQTKSKPIKSLGRWYDSTLNDNNQTCELREELSKVLKSIDESMLPGKRKIWCLQFGLLSEQMKRRVSPYVRKWLGLPRCLSNVALYGQGLLQLPLSDSLKYLNALKWDWRWCCQSQKIQWLELTHQLWKLDGSGQLRTQSSRQNLHSTTVTLLAKSNWSRTTPADRRKMIHRHEEERRCAKAVAQGKQGQWTRWETVEKQNISWKDMWTM